MTGINYDVDNLSEVGNVTSVSECQSLCQGLVGCAGFTYNYVTEFCYTKPTLENEMTKDNNISGPANCNN